MKTKRIFAIAQLNDLKPSTSISTSISQESFNYYITEWHITNSTKEEKIAKADNSTSNLEDKKSLSPICF